MPVFASLSSGAYKAGRVNGQQAVDKLPLLIFKYWKSVPGHAALVSLRENSIGEIRRIALHINVSDHSSNIHVRLYCAAEVI
jgi:hypothetical protein